MFLFSKHVNCGLASLETKLFDRIIVIIYNIDWCISGLYYWVECCYMIKFATDENLDGLKLLFKDCFNLDFCSPYGFFYLTNIFKNYKPLIFLEDKKVVSMLTLIPLQLVTNVGVFSGFYIWGLGTLKDFRNQNLATQMLNFVSDYSKKLNKDFNLLIPEAGKNYLYDFYFKKGFKTDINHKILLVEKQRVVEFLKSQEISEINLNVRFFTVEDSEKLKKIRRRNFLTVDSKIGYLEWGNSELEIVQKELSLPGSNHYIVGFDDDQYCVLDLRDKKVLKIREMCVKKQFIGNFFEFIFKTYSGFDFFEFSFPNVVCDDCGLKFVSRCFDGLNGGKRCVEKKVAMFKQIPDNTLKNVEASSNIKQFENLYFNFGLDT